MKKFLKALPLPACGVMLGLAALGNLLQAVFTNIFGSAGMGDTLRYICGALSSVIWIALVLKLKFYPSYAAFTFPFAITAIAAMQSMAFFKNAGWPQPWLRYVVIVETVIAVVMNLYAFIKYVQAIPALMKQD